jgi:hypothetical protein
LQRRVGHPAIQSAKPRAAVGADREMKGVPRAKVELRLGGVAGRGAKILAGDLKNPKAFNGKPGERRKRRRAMIGAEAACAQFYRQGEANSVTVQSLIVSSAGSCSASQI